MTKFSRQTIPRLTHKNRILSERYATNHFCCPCFSFCSRNQHQNHTSFSKTELISYDTHNNNYLQAEHTRHGKWEFPTSSIHNRFLITFQTSQDSFCNKSLIRIASSINNSLVPVITRLGCEEAGLRFIHVKTGSQTEVCSRNVNS